MDCFEYVPGVHTAGCGTDPISNGPTSGLQETVHAYLRRAASVIINVLVPRTPLSKLHNKDDVRFSHSVRWEQVKL